MFGGYNNNYIAKLERYDPETDQWTTAASPDGSTYYGGLTTNSNLFGVTGVAINNKFYSYGGSKHKFLRYDESAGNNDSSRWKNLGTSKTGGGTTQNNNTYAPMVYSYSDNSIYVLGGRNHNVSYKYDLTQTEGSGTWDTIPTPSIKLSGQEKAVIHGTDIYVLNGNVTLGSKLYVFDIEAQQWKNNYIVVDPLAGLDAFNDHGTSGNNLQYFSNFDSICLMGNFIYFLGGNHKHSSSNWPALKHAYRLNISLINLSDLDSAIINATAEKITSMNIGHGIGSAAAECDGYVYMVSGEWKRSNYTNVAERYNPNTNTWENVDTVNYQRRHHCLVTNYDIP